MGKKIALTCQVDDLKTEGFALRRDLSQGARAKRASKALGICWFVAWVSVFVPLLHFFLVPLFLIVGLVLGFLVWMAKAEVLGGEVICPNCAKVNQLPRDSENWPVRRRCDGCSFVLTIDPLHSSVV